MTNLTTSSNKMVCPGGVEPPTYSLEGCCSIQLSYGHALLTPPASLSQAQVKAQVKKAVAGFPLIY